MKYISLLNLVKVFLVFLFVHIVEDIAWIFAGRYTDIAFWMLIIGVIVIAGISALISRKVH